MALVVCALVFACAFPVQLLIRQRGAIADLEQQQVNAQERVAKLEERRDDLEDPEHIKALAKERLHYVLPGDNAYITVMPPEDAGNGPAENNDDVNVARNGAWFESLWESVRVADES